LTVKNKKWGLVRKRYLKGLLSRKMLRALKKGCGDNHWVLMEMQKRKWTFSHLNKFAKGDWNKPKGGRKSNLDLGMNVWKRKGLI